MNVRDAILGRLPEARRLSRGSSLKQSLLTNAPWYLYSSPSYQIWLSLDEETRGSGQERIWTGDNPEQNVFGFRDVTRDIRRAFSLERLTDEIVSEMSSRTGPHGLDERKAASEAIARWIDERLAEMPPEFGNFNVDSLRSRYVNSLCFLDPARAMQHIGENFDGYEINWRESLLPQNHIALIQAKVAEPGSLAAFQNQPPEVQLNPDDIWLWFNAIDLPALFSKEAQATAKSLLVNDDLPSGWEEQTPFNRDMLGYVDSDSWDQIREALGRFRVEGPQGGWVQASEVLGGLDEKQLVDWVETQPQAEGVRRAVAMAYGDSLDRATFDVAYKEYLDALNDLFDGTMNVVESQNRYRFTLAYRKTIERLEEYERATGNPFTGDLRDLPIELGFKIETPNPEYWSVRLDDENFNDRLSNYLYEVRPDYDEGQKEFEFDEPK